MMTPTLQVTCVTLAILFHFIHPNHIVVVVVVVMIMMTMIVLYSDSLKEFKIVKMPLMYFL
jgi:hypothetical protein